MIAFSARHKEILEQDKNLFSKRESLMSFWQESAENFYPERADFTAMRSLGSSFAGNLDTSYPLLARRDLGNSFGAMLRPSQKDWFHIRKKTQGNDAPEEERQWLERAEKTQRRAMYDRLSGFVRATKEADHDFAAFGQAVLSSELATHPAEGQILLHRSWHLKDVAWVEDAWGMISEVHRRWNPTARQLNNLFRGKVSEQVQQLAKKEPFKAVPIRHIIIAQQDWEKNFGRPWVSMFIEVDKEHVLEEVGSWTRYYIIPRWETVSGSQYAYSPAIVAALPDARLIQAMTYTLLTAGEKAVDPPLIGVAEAVKGGVESYAGGFTAVDAAYDERLGEVVRPLHLTDHRAIPVGLNMTQDIRSQIAEAFYLNKLTLPDTSSVEMTAFEVARRIEEFVRGALPLFEPMESDYNGMICEQDFDILLRAGAFGSPQDMPSGLRGAETEFSFESPLRDATDRILGQKLIEAKGMVAEIEPLDASAIKMLDARTALRDALRGIGTPARWMVNDDEMDMIVEQDQQRAQAAELLQTVSAGAQVAEQISGADQAEAIAEQEEAAAINASEAA